MEAIYKHIAEEITKAFGRPFEVEMVKPVSGGCINRCYCIESKYDRYFIKLNQAGNYPKLFELEEAGLQLLSEKSTIEVVEPLLKGSFDGYAYLVLEWIESSYPQKRYWENFGHQLAKQHMVSAEQFGLEYDNYIGALVQYNKQHDDWATFFIEQRLKPQLKYGMSKGVFDGHFVSYVEQLFPVISKDFFPKEAPALLHGDLWSGNFMINSNGEACIFDPAVYFGHREMEIAFTKLFGGFDPAFYEAYEAILPLEKGFDRREDVYNLYSLLVHANLFGGGYVNQVKQIVGRYL